MENDPAWFSDPNLNFHVWQLGAPFLPHPAVKLTHFVCRSLKVNKLEHNDDVFYRVTFQAESMILKISISGPLLLPLISAHSELYFVLPDLASSLFLGKPHFLWQYHCTGICINVAEYKHLYEQLVHLVLDLFYSKHAHAHGFIPNPCSCVRAPMHGMPRYTYFTYAALDQKSWLFFPKVC